PFDGYNDLLTRRFEEAIDSFLAEQKAHGPADPISSALAAAYHDLGFQTLANQVRRSVRSVRGNQWMFRIGHPADQPLYLRPVLRLVSVDLGARADITSLPEVFDFAKDYLGLLKAAVIASGIVPPGMEGSGRSLGDLLSRVVGSGLGLEIVSSVNNIPKGSRL